MIRSWCSSCNDFHSLDSELAKPYARAVLSRLTTSGKLAEPENGNDYSTAHLYGATGGKMFGVLLCEDKEGREVVLKAFSGKYNDHRSIPGWCPHLFDDIAFNSVVAEGNTIIHPLTQAIAAEPDAEKRKQLITKRKAVSKPILEKLYGLYEAASFGGELLTLRQAYSGTGNIPTGTGDCCAPKLLNYAARNGLKPVSLAEFYLGKPLRNSDKKEGEFYEPCTEKCAPLLGRMLCGLPV